MTVKWEVEWNGFHAIKFRLSCLNACQQAPKIISLKIKLFQKWLNTNYLSYLCRFKVLLDTLALFSADSFRTILFTLSKKDNPEKVNYGKITANVE